MATTLNNDNSKIKVTAWPVTHVLVGPSRFSSDLSSNSDLLIIKFKAKVNLINVSSDHNNNNNSPVVRKKARAEKYKGEYTVSRRELLSDDGSPTSRSWATMSNLIATVSSSISFPLQRVHWVDHQQLSTRTTLLEGRDQLIARVHQTAKTMASGSAMDLLLPNRRCHLHLCIKKELFLNHDGFVSRVHRLELTRRVRDSLIRCMLQVLQLHPPIDVETVRREIVRDFSVDSTMIQPTNDMLDSMTNWIMNRVALRESLRHPMTAPAGEDVINSLPCVVFVDPDEEECAVCREIFLSGDVVNPLNCEHIYHPNCVRQWLQISNRCPLCRAVVTGGPYGLCHAKVSTQETQA